MTHAEYAALPGINWSTLKHMRDSPKAYLHAVNNPRADTLPFALGRALHALVLEPHTFWDSFEVWNDGDRRGAKWRAFEEQHAGSTILKADEYDLVNAMAEAVRTDPVAAKYLEGGTHERPITWTDPSTGLVCKARPDTVIESSRRLVDLKSTRSVDGRRFGAESARFGYQLQMAHYWMGVLQHYGWRPAEVAIIAVEKTPPHDVGVFEVDPIALQLASDEVSELLQRLADCRSSGNWPGRYSEVQALQLPAWVYSNDDEDDAEGFGLTFGGQ